MARGLSARDVIAIGHAKGVFVGIADTIAKFGLTRIRNETRLTKILFI
jgi:hypothetical protein